MQYRGEKDSEQRQLLVLWMRSVAAYNHRDVDEEDLDRLDALNLGNLFKERCPKEFRVTFWEMAGSVARFMPQLRTLDLSDSDLDALPDEIALFTNLEVLELSNNCFSVVPDVVTRLKKLAKLSFMYNKLEVVPPEIGNLEWLKDLNLCCNRLSELPVDFSRLQALETLALTSNRFSVFPVEIAELVNLEALYLADNPFSTLPGELEKLSKLKHLYLGGPNLKVSAEVIEKIFSLAVLRLDSNQQMIHPKGTTHLTQLTCFVRATGTVYYTRPEYEHWVNCPEVNWALWERH